MRSQWSYTDETGKLVQRKPVTGETITNSNGLPVQEFELTEGERELVKSWGMSIMSEWGTFQSGD